MESDINSSILLQSLHSGNKRQIANIPTDIVKGVFVELIKLPNANAGVSESNFLKKVILCPVMVQLLKLNYL